MPRPLLIIHGWSDNSQSFRPLARKLRKELRTDVKVIDLADYESMDDEVTFDDIVSAMDRAWNEHRLPRRARSVDVVVHSTGGLVIRDWMTRNFAPDRSPVRHLVMLAPANFGSPLAHKGHSFIGRVVKGWNSKKMFETGERVLKGLELASPYSWDLAMRDRFGTKTWYGPGRVLCTVLVGNKGYSGISAAANEDGSDGTVRVSTANLNAAWLQADFSRNAQKPTVTLRRSRGRVGFGVMRRENHSTVAGKGGFKNPDTLGCIVRGLKVTDRRFSAWCSELAKRSRAVMDAGKDDSETHGYQNTVFLVQDQFGESVKDYFLEFYLDDDDSGWLEELFHKDAIRSVHAHGDNAAYRSVYIDCTRLHEKLNRPHEHMRLSLTARPEYRRNGNVGYRTFTDEDIGGIRIRQSDVKKVFQENRTLLVRILLKRHQSKKVFGITRAPK